MVDRYKWDEREEINFRRNCFLLFPFFSEIYRMERSRNHDNGRKLYLRKLLCFFCEIGDICVHAYIGSINLNNSVIFRNI